ncbi:MAG: carbohydrate binding family 9 domain-containing protein [Rhodoferax sp.]|nr:carbohydrate binding family 9 domain-containing protein [Rhodoferax sp.]
MTLKKTFTLLLLFALAGSACAQASPDTTKVSGARLLPGEKITLDGSLDHPAWKRAPVYNRFVERAPNHGAEPKFETRLQVLVDERAVYVGVTALDPQPELIRRQLVRHDQVFRTQDFVALYLDPMGRKKAAQWFRVGASGSTADGLHTAEDDNEDFSPDFDFDAASKLTQQGYTAVFRVPFSSLRYSAAGVGEGSLPWRMMVVRRVPRDQTYLLMSVPLARDAASFIDDLQTVEGMAPTESHSFLQWRPNLTLRRSTEHPAGQSMTGDTQANLGLELKWRPRPELVVDATLRPDFSQVELDVPQLSSNTQFALYLPEKRPFFLESSDLLRSPTDALYTRSVTRPRWGLRASWRSDAVAATGFATHDLGGGDVLLPGPYGTSTAPQGASDAAIARLRVDRDHLTVGALASLRRYDLHQGDNSVAGPDLTWQATPNLRLRAQWLASRTTALPDGNGALVASAAQTGSALYANAFWRAEPYEAGATIENKTIGFRNDNGFVTQTGVRRLALDAHRVWRNLGPLNEVWLNVNAENVQDPVTRATVYSQVTPGLYTGYSNNSEFSVEYRGLTRQRVSAGSDLLQERYWHFYYTRNAALWAPVVSVEYDRGKMVDVSANQVRAGQRIKLSATLRPLARLELLPTWSLAQLQAPQGGTTYRESAAQLLAIWHLAPQQTLRLIVQRSQVDRQSEPLRGVAAYVDRSQADSLTYTWRRSAGTTYYLGANRGRTGVAPEQSRSTELFAKMQVDIDEWRSR